MLRRTPLCASSFATRSHSGATSLLRRSTVAIAPLFVLPFFSSACIHSQFRFCSSATTTTTTHTTAAAAAQQAAEEAKKAAEEAKKVPISVHWSVTPNPDSLRFYSMELSFLPPGSTLDFPNESHAYKSPLAQMLFNVPGVNAVFISDEYVTVTKENSVDWDELTVHVKNTIVEFAHSGVNILSDEGETELQKGYPDTEPQPGDSDVVLAIKELLHTRIRPMLAGDGGGLRFVAFEDGLVYLVLTGACKTCPSSGQTLKLGIERMLMYWCPEVSEVVEVDELWAEDYQKQFEAEKAKNAQHQQTQEEREKAAAGDATTTASTK